GRLTRPYWQMATANALGTSYATLGQTGRAIEHYQQALAIAREAGDRGVESSALGSLGTSYATLGQTGRAIEHYQQVLAIARELGRPGGESGSLGGLGRSYAALGQTGRAVEHYQQALAIAREIGDRDSEGCWLGGLGGCHADLGQTGQAIDYYQQAAEIGDDIGDAQVQAEACLGLAYARLYRGEWPEARRAAEAARSHGYGPVLPQVFAALGTAHLREGDRADAGEAFSAALSAANTLLAGT